MRSRVNEAWNPKYIRWSIWKPYNVNKAFGNSWQLLNPDSQLFSGHNSLLLLGLYILARVEAVYHWQWTDEHCHVQCVFSLLFLRLISKPQFWNHLTNSSTWTCGSGWFILLRIFLQTLTLSVNNSVDDIGSLGNSLTFRRKNRLPEMMPLSIPFSNGLHPYSISFTFSLCCEQKRKFLIHSCTIRVVTNLESFYTRHE